VAKSTFGFDAPEASPGFLLWQTTVTWQRLIKKILEEYDVSHAQFVIMAILLWFEENHEETTQSLIVNMSKLDKMTVSKSLKKLVAQGFVNRTENQLDTRVKSVTLTQTGKVLVKKLVPLVEKIDAEFFGVLPQKDQCALINILDQLML